MPKYYSVKDASIILGFSTNSIYKFLDEGRLQGTRGNAKQGRFRLTKKSFEEFLGTSLTHEQLQKNLDDYYYYEELERQKKAPAKQVINPQASAPSPNNHLPDQTPTNSSPPKRGLLGLQVARGLIILCLLLVLADMFYSKDFSLFQQFMRLVMLAIIIVLTYQYGESQEQQDSSL